jgi:hypothetical protein
MQQSKTMGNQMKNALYCRTPGPSFFGYLPEEIISLEISDFAWFRKSL